MTARFEFESKTIDFTVPAPAPEQTILTFTACPKSQPKLFTLKLVKTKENVAIYRVAMVENQFHP